MSNIRISVTNVTGKVEGKHIVSHVVTVKETDPISWIFECYALAAKHELVFGDCVYGHFVGGTGEPYCRLILADEEVFCDHA